MYTISNELINNAVVVADSLEAAELQAYAVFGMDAIGCNVKGENGDFRCTVCRKAWEQMLAKEFAGAGFSMQDVFNHLALQVYARITFGTVEDTEYVYGEGKTTVIRLSDAGANFLKKCDHLGNYMCKTGFGW